MKLLEMIVGAHEFDVPETMLDRKLEQLVVNEKYSAKQSRNLMNKEIHGKGQEAEDAELLKGLKEGHKQH